MFRVPFALTAAGRWVTPSQVKKADGPFACVECSQKVQLRAGKQLRAHFAHLPDEDGTCGGGAGESWQHKAAKHMIAQSLDTWRFAPLCIVCKCPDDTESRSFGAARFRAQVEAPNAPFVIDVGVMDGKRMAAAIEIRHTHAVGADKFAVLERKCVHVIEVGASDVLVCGSERCLSYRPLGGHTCGACWTKANCKRCKGCLGWFPPREVSEMGAIGSHACLSCRAECPDCGEWTLEHDIDQWTRCKACHDHCQRWLADSTARTWDAPLGVRKTRVYRSRVTAERLARELAEADEVMNQLLASVEVPSRSAKRRRVS